MKFPKIETERLILRIYKPEELERVYDLCSDKDITRYFPPEYSVKKDDVLTSLPRRKERWQTQGFGQFGVFDKTEENLLGYCGLQFLDKTELVEIYYGFFREFWGKGFATEAAKAVLRFGFEQIKLPKIVGVTHPDNFDSQKVLKKVGLNGGGNARFYNMEVVYFELAAKKFKPDKSFYKLSRTKG